MKAKKQAIRRKPARRSEKAAATKATAAKGTGRTGTKRRSMRIKSSVRRKVRARALKAIQKGNLTFDQLSRLADEILAEGVATVKSALPASRRSALRQTIQGLGDAWAVTARSSAKGLEHAKQNGVRFAKRDLTQLSRHLQSLEKDLVETVDKYARRLGGDIGNELLDAAARVRRTGTAIRPAVRTAGRAVAEHGTEVVRDLAATGLNVSARALSGALVTAGNLLEKIGEAVSPKSTKRRAR